MLIIHIPVWLPASDNKADLQQVPLYWEFKKDIKEKFGRYCYFIFNSLLNDFILHKNEVLFIQTLICIISYFR